MRQKIPTALPKKARNLLHDHPLMKKGGIHEKTKKSKRHQDKIQLKKGWPDLGEAIRQLLTCAANQGNIINQNMPGLC